MKILIKGIWLILMLLLSISGKLLAQSSLIAFPSQINSDSTIKPGAYLVNGNCLVSRGAVLTIVSGVNMVFGTDAALVIEGGLNITGDNNAMIEFSSSDRDNPGAGIKVRGNDSSVINISHCRFIYMSKPIHLERNWIRNAVNIHHCVFKFSRIYGASVEINDIDNVLAEKEINIKIDGNTFCNNSGSLLISNFSSSIIKVSLKQNVITCNDYLGRDFNGMFTSPVFLNYNASPGQKAPEFSMNSIFDNFSNIWIKDSFFFEYSNIFVVGSADTFDITDNYFGSAKNKELEKTISYVHENAKAPKLIYSSLDDVPDSSLNGHCYNISLNGEEVNNLTFNQKLVSGKNTLELYFNKPITKTEGLAMSYYFIQADTFVALELKPQLNWSKDHKKLIVEFKDTLLGIQKNGYVYLNGFYDENGIDAPALIMGKKVFLNPKYSNESKYAKIKENDSLVNPVILLPVTNADTVVRKDNIDKTISLNKVWELGAFVGATIYMGDLVSSSFAVSSSTKPALIIKSRYHFNDHLQVNFSAGYLMISGSDIRASANGDQRGTGYERGLSFTTRIIDLGATLEYDFIKVKSKSTYVPSVFVGVNAFYFIPTAKYDGKAYKLRLIGTEGQTIPGGSGPYKPYSFGIPVGVSLRKNINKNNSIAISYTYTKTFTDYLDDVSTGTYPDSTALIKANPKLGRIAVALSNPNNQTGQRSSSAAKDGYGYWGITILHRMRW